MAGAQVPVPPDLEPGGAPPLTLPEEPQYAPPPGLGEPSLFEAEASSCTQLHFTTLCRGALAPLFSPSIV